MSTRTSLRSAASLPDASARRAGALLRRHRCGEHEIAEGECAGSRVHRTASQTVKTSHDTSSEVRSSGIDMTRVPLSSSGRSLGIIQAKLELGSPRDEYELEADRIADHLTCESELPTSTIGGKSRDPRPQPVRNRDPRGPLYSVPSHIEPRISSLSGGGRPLPAKTLDYFERRLETDFTGVRIHSSSDASNLASSLGARAFTYGRNIVFNSGEYAPESRSGRRLLAHELVHVVQQGESRSFMEPSGARRSASGNISGNTSGNTSGNIVQGAISQVLDLIESYLSYSFTDWMITETDAITALELLRKLPPFQQAVFISNSTLLGRLRGNLPEDRVQEVDDIVSKVGSITPSSDVVEKIRSKLSYSIIDWEITEDEAVESLEMLKKLTATKRAVALASIDYERLLDNLPESRKKELIKMYQESLGAKGEREKQPGAEPYSSINSIKFTNDHGLLKDNTSDWSSSGTAYAEPEWSVTGSAGMVSYPISQTKGKDLKIEMDLNVLPDVKKPINLKLEGRSDVGFLDFDYAGTTRGGQNQKIKMTSKGSLPDKITEFHNKVILWRMTWQSWEGDLSMTGPHTVFVTYDKPTSPAEVTHKRMAKAIELTRGFGNDPHSIVSGQMDRFPRYYLGPGSGYTNIWDLAGSISAGTTFSLAQCQAIVRFVKAINEIVGIPGTARGITVYASPWAPGTPLVGTLNPDGTGPGMYLFSVDPSTGHKAWLFDGSDNANNYEAALEFQAGGSKLYYPGGAGGGHGLKTTKDVLHTFAHISWARFDHITSKWVPVTLILRYR